MSRSLLKESAVRKAIDDLLAHLGWITDEYSADCHVFTERAKTTRQNAQLQGLKPDYVLYEPDTDRPVAVIEAKRPGHNLDRAVQYAAQHYAVRLNVNIIFASDGTLFQSFDRRSNGPLLLDGEPVVDLLPPKLTVQFADDGPSLVTPDSIAQTKSELMNVFKGANDLLRKEGLREGIERFGEFSNLLFLKLVSEIEMSRELRNEGRRLHTRYCWESFSTRPAPEMLDYLNDTVLPRLADIYNHGDEVFTPRLAIARPDTLGHIVDGLSGLSLLDVDSDVKGDAFEYFLKHSVTVGNDLGEYFTPRHIVKLVVDLVDPMYMEQVYDPCCGTGGFLIEAFRHIARKVKQTDQTRQVLENDTIFGRELTGTARIAKMNMILAGDGHTHIHQGDCLQAPVKERFDVVLTNFPFSQDTDCAGLYGFNTRDANPVFLKHAVDACRDGGRIGIVVPEGLLFSEAQQYENVRRHVLDTCSVIAVIAFDEFAFRPYTGQPTAVLILDKGATESPPPIWFFEVLEDGFEKTTRKNGRPAILDGRNDLVRLRSLWGEKAETEQSFLVDVERVRDNACKLSLSSYRPGRSASQADAWVPIGGDQGVCDIVIGATPATRHKAYWGHRGRGHAWATISDMQDRYVTATERTITDEAVQRTSVKKLPKGTVLLSFKLTVGKLAIAGCDLFTNEAIAGLVPKDERILSEYLYHLMPAIDLRSHVQPAAKGHTLNKKILENIRIPVPSRAQQVAFVDRMNDLEAGVLDLREKANILNREMTATRQTFVMTAERTSGTTGDAS